MNAPLYLTPRHCKWLARSCFRVNPWKLEDIGGWLVARDPHRWSRASKRQEGSVTSDERRTKKEERRKKNEERRTKNVNAGTMNVERKPAMFAIPGER